MTQSEPFEIIVAPYEVYLAPVGEAFPDINDAPSGNWSLLGTSGNRDYGEEGVTVTHEQTLAYHRFLGSTGPRKASRTEEGLRIGLVLHDCTLEALESIFNGNSITTTAAGGGEPGDKAVGMYQGLSVAQYALLVRGPGPYGASFNQQYEVPVVVRDGSPAPVYSKGEPAGYALEFVALEDPEASSADERFGHLRAQHAAVSP